MKPIQFLLIPLFLFLIFFIGKNLKGQLFLKMSLWAVLVLGTLSVLFHEKSTDLANLMGIGRGVDLIMYLSIIGLGICCMLLYLRTLRLEQMLAELVQKRAIEEAKKLK